MVGGNRRVTDCTNVFLFESTIIFFPSIILNEGKNEEKGNGKKFDIVTIKNNLIEFHQQVKFMKND